jgi:hypothetical protein
MPVVRDEQVVGLEFRNDVEEDGFGVRLIVGINVDIEPLTPVAHVLTVMSQRVDHLFARDDPGKAELGDAGPRGFAICDPGGLLQRTGHEQLKVFVELFVERRWPEIEELCEVVCCE